MDEKLYEGVIAERKKTPNILSPSAAQFSDGKQTIAVANGHLRGFAQGLIDNVDNHRHLKQAQILLLVKTMASTAKKIERGEVFTAGQASKTSPMTKMLSCIGSAPKHQADFVVWISGDWMDAIGITEKGGAEIVVTTDELTAKAIALIDHELMHCAAKIAGEYIDPDVLHSFREGLGDRHIETCPEIVNDKDHVLVRYEFCNTEGKPEFKIRKHDIEEFNDIIARHGAWDAKIEKMVDVMIEHQPTLFNQPKAASKKKTKKEKAA